MKIEKLRTIQEAIKILESEAPLYDSGTVESIDHAKSLARLRIGAEESEVFACFWLDNKHRVRKFDTLALGTIDGATVHPRPVVKAALKHNAAAVMFTHNHPSGICEPSQADLRITERLVDALRLIDVRVLDHIIVSHTDAVSLAERGLI